MLSKKKTIHFVGIGGVGTSGLAQVLLDKGFQVTGSDLKRNAFTERVESKGGKIYLGHKGDNVKGAGIVVYSSAASPDNPELIEAKNNHIPTLRRAELLAELTKKKTSIAVTGSHGKTTTTSLIALILNEAHLKPSYLIGADVEQLNGNAHLGTGKLFVVEADESDGSFLFLNPTYAVITNIDKEHLDYYRNIHEIITAYLGFAQRLDKKGILVCSYDCQNVRKLLDVVNRKHIRYGTSQDCDFYPKDIQMCDNQSSFKCMRKGKPLGLVRLNVPGLHNILNSLAACAVSLELGVEFKAIQQALYKYEGARRRFQLKGEVNGVMVIDDYAHHPNEVRATIDAARNWKNRRIVCVFQPHRYSRMMHLLNDFKGCFDGVSHLVITDIYAASERPIPGVNGEDLCSKVKEHGFKDAIFISKDQVLDHLKGYLKSGDITLMIGAGDITDLSDELMSTLKGVN